ncbi:MAG TPA: hypothetical protein VI522_03105, partial [Gammaproteobacteria bacterium]|nr:hypothetical protein [Gammaproteobacteria bacterium]
GAQGGDLVMRAFDNVHYVSPTLLRGEHNATLSDDHSDFSAASRYRLSCVTALSCPVTQDKLLNADC